MATIADYLTELLNKGKSYRIINNHESAISAFHTPICGIRVGQQELICKVVGACFNGNLPQPKYVVTWDVNKVLVYIHSLGDNSTLSDNFSLESAGRSSDLRALNVRYKSVIPSCDPVRYKSVIPSCDPGDPFLCVYSVINLVFRTF